jgi:hypothetical protein
MNKNLKSKIIELRKKGYSYKKIKIELNCSKSTVAFHCGEGVKEKALIGQRRRRKSNPLRKKIENFLRVKKINEKYSPMESPSMSILKRKTWGFVRVKKEGYKERMFNEEKLIEKIGNEPKCYLTGRSISLDDSRSYHLDHIIPKSRGGDNSLENCEIACREANQAKNDMSYNDFVQLCREVVAYDDLKQKQNKTK